jgi:hypothetical protein
MRSIKFDYKWKERQEGDEITWRYTFIHIYKLSYWLENYIIMNCLHAKKIISKFELVVKDDASINEFKNIYYNRSFQQLILKEENMRSEIIRFYASHFMKGSIVKAKKELESCIHHKSSFIRDNKDLIKIFVLCGIIFAEFLVFLIVSLTYPDKSKFHIYFAAFSFTFIVLLFLILFPIIIMIFLKYQINYIYLFELDPQLKYNPLYILKVNIIKIDITLTINFLVCFTYNIQNINFILFRHGEG